MSIWGWLQGVSTNQLTLYARESLLWSPAFIGDGFPSFRSKLIKKYVSRGFKFVQWHLVATAHAMVKNVYIALHPMEPPLSS